MKPIDIRIENYSTKTGVTCNPVISWEYADSDAGQQQEFCRIFVYQNDRCVYDSGRVRTQDQTNHEIHMDLYTHQTYSIIVEAENTEGNIEISDNVYFSTGVMEGEWCGEWISDKSSLPHYLRGEIEINRPVDKAYISVAGAGQYELKINGKFPDDSVLNGSWTDFNKRIHYRTFEIEKILRMGSNIFSIEVGNGWYHAETDERHFYTIDKGYENFGDFLCATAVITLRFSDGEVVHMGTGPDWKTGKSETLFTNIYGSEDYDARMEEESEWSPAIVLKKTEAPKGRLLSMGYPPVIVKKKYRGIRVNEFPDGSVLYDLHQNMAGLFEIAVSGKRGTKLEIIPVEKLDEKGYPQRTVESWSTYILKGAPEETWRPRFTYGAGRYIQIKTAEESEEKSMPEILRVCGYFVTSSAEDAGRFSCSDFRYMKIHDLVLRAVESNLNHVHTDCPTIERLGWQEPNHLMAPSIMYVKNVNTLWDKMAEDQKDSQYSEGEEDTDKGVFPHEYSKGLIPSIAPRYAKFLYDCGEGSFWDIVPWGSSILLAAWEQARFYGNWRTFLSNYPFSKRYVKYLYRKYCDYGRIYKKDPDVHSLCHGLGDWGIEQNKGETRENVETAYLYIDMLLLSKAAEMLGLEESLEFRKLAEEIRERYNKELLVKNTDTGEWCYKTYDSTGLRITQADQAIPLWFNMVPEEKRKSVERSLILACRDKVLRTGEIGLPYILRCLGELGQADLVHEMIIRDRHPGYYRFILNGETTLPEFWRDDARSRNHDMMGAVLEWFYRYLCGISSDDGYRTIRIKPILPRAIRDVSCGYRAATGMINVRVFRMEGKELCIQGKIPVNTSGKVEINSRVYEIEGGRTWELR